MLLETFRWLEKQGGLAEMERRNERKAALVYEAIDRSNGFYYNWYDAKTGARGMQGGDVVRAIRERDGEAEASRALADKAAAVNPPATDPRGIPARLTA